MNIEKDQLQIGNKSFTSRLFTGTGKYPSVAIMKESLVNSQCEMVTVAIRRIQSMESGHKGLMEAINWEKFWMLPNTAGCSNAEEAIRVARLGRELAKLAGQENNNFIKLEVIPDKKYLLPDPFGTLEAAEKLVNEGFTVPIGNNQCWYKENCLLKTKYNNNILIEEKLGYTIISSSK